MRSAGGALEQDIASVTICGHIDASSSSWCFVPRTLAVAFLLCLLLLENGESACILAESAPFCPATAAAIAIRSFSLQLCMFVYIRRFFRVTKFHNQRYFSYDFYVMIFSYSYSYFAWFVCIQHIRVTHSEYFVYSEKNRKCAITLTSHNSILH